jgi:hypothetical protein
MNDEEDEMSSKWNHSRLYAFGACSKPRQTCTSGCSKMILQREAVIATDTGTSQSEKAGSTLQYPSTDIPENIFISTCMSDEESLDEVENFAKEFFI